MSFWFYHTWTPTKLIGRIWNIWYVQTSWRNLHLPVSLTPPSVATWWSLLLELSYSKLMTRFYLRNLTTSDCSSNHIILCTSLYIVLTRNWLEHRFCRHIHNLNSVPLKLVCQDEGRLNASRPHRHFNFYNFARNYNCSLIMSQGPPSTTNGSTTSQPPLNGERVDPGGFKLKFCTVCASNNNRYVVLYASCFSLG